MTHQTNLNHLTTFEQTYQQLLINILTNSALPFPVSTALLAPSKSSPSNSSSPKQNKIPSAVRNQIQILLHLDYFEHSLLYHLVMHDKMPVLMEWLNQIYQMLREGHFSTSEAKRMESILQECFCVLAAKTWAQDAMRLMHENGKEMLNWDTQEYRKMRAQGMNPMHYACDAQNLASVRWLSKVVGLSLTYPDDQNRNGFDLWLNSSRTPNTQTSEFIKFALGAGYSPVVLRKTIEEIPLLKLQENLKKQLDKYSIGG